MRILNSVCKWDSDLDRNKSRTAFKKPVEIPQNVQDEKAPVCMFQFSLVTQ